MGSCVPGYIKIKASMIPGGDFFACRSYFHRHRMNYVIMVLPGDFRACHLEKPAAFDLFTLRYLISHCDAGYKVCTF